MHSPERQEQLRQAFREANAIVDLTGLPFDESMGTIQARVIKGEISISEAIQILTHSVKGVKQ